jgi:toxin ParE1/3/4
MGKVIWSASALEDLSHALKYIARDNPRAALEIGERILEQIKTLSAFPKMARIVRRVNGTEIRRKVIGPYNLYYSVGPDDSVYIHHLWHGARLEPGFSAN